MRSKALAEIHTMHSFAQLCNLNFLSKFRKIVEIFATNFLEKCDFRAVQRSALCRSRRELSNAYFLAKFGFDTAENEPSKVCCARNDLSRAVEEVAKGRIASGVVIGSLK